MRLYHYRSVENGLLEIKNKTFHFSDKEELNDPIEGYLQIYWQGDKPAWEGLFRNYIASLFRSILNYLLAAPYDIICNSATIPSVEQFYEVPLGKMLDNLGDTFIASNSLNKLIDYLSENDICCSANFLKVILQLVHETAYAICVDKIEKEQLSSDPMPKPEKNLLLGNLAKKFPKNLWSKIAEQEKEQLIKFVEFLVSPFEDYSELQMIYNEEKNSVDFTQRQIWIKLRTDFPDLYIRQMQEILYPKEYVVCFSGNGTNSVMWGNYAESHKGVCLIYQTKTKNEREYISVKSNPTYSNHDREFDFRDCSVKKIEYGNTLPKRNFFCSLGRLTRNQILSWLMPDRKNASIYLENYDSEEWRQQYWEDFDKKYHSKMQTWAYEEEYRISISDWIYSYSSGNRNIQYDPNALVGVIFGIKTSIQSKKKILEALKQSGKDLNALEIYQAQYNDETQSIILRKKYDLIKFNSSKVANDVESLGKA